MGSERRDDPSEPPPEKDADARPEAAAPSRPGARLRRLRLERGLSLNDLSRLTHSSKGYLSKIETDEKALTSGVARRCDDALETGGELSELVALDTREEEAEGADGEAAVEMCPYRGLAAYSPQDHRWFFGREGSVSVLLAWLTARLEGAGPLVVAAPSGAGKSSLLRAGLLPAIGRGLLPEAGSSTWPTLLITPGESPVGELLGRLDRITGTPVPVLAEALARDPALFAAHVRRGLNRAFPLPGRPEDPGKDPGREKAVPGAGGGGRGHAAPGPGRRPVRGGLHALPRRGGTPCLRRGGARPGRPPGR